MFFTFKGFYYKNAFVAYILYLLYESYISTSN